MPRGNQRQVPPVVTTAVLIEAVGSDKPETGGVKMGMWLLILSCLGDPAVCHRVLEPWNEARFGSEVRCMVEGESIVKSNARTNPGDNIAITYSCRPFAEDNTTRMGVWLLMLSCLGDPAACHRVLGPWNEARFGSEARCMVEGESIVKSNARTNPGDNIAIRYSCRPFTEEDAKKAAQKHKDDDHK
jgi:hypothetical protein